MNNVDIMLPGIGMPVSFLFVRALVMAWRKRTPGSFLQLIGAACLMVVVLAHVCELLSLLPWMGWGRPHSPGHYLDLASAALGLTLLPLGYLLAVIAGRNP